MLAEAERLSVGEIRDRYERVYREMRRAGYTAVGEFHYLGLEEARAAAEAAAAASLGFVLLLTAYARGGVERFRQPSVRAYLDEAAELSADGITVGLAPHSVRACPPEWLEAIGGHSERNGLLLHVHANEQPREIEECMAEHGVRPIELLAKTGCLGPRTTVVHATHADERELDRIAEAGARICVCPSTEANLGDGFVPVEAIVERGIELCIGSDSNVRIDPFEELRELEGIARRQSGRRNVVSVDALWRCGTATGAAALGLDEWQEIEVDLAHPSLEGISDEEVAAALLFGCAADVVVS